MYEEASTRCLEVEKNHIIQGAKGNFNDQYFYDFKDEVNYNDIYTQAYYEVISNTSKMINVFKCL